MTTTAGWEGPAKVVSVYPPFCEKGYEVNLFDVNLRFFSMTAFGEHAMEHAYKYKDQINRALAPLAKKAALADRMAEEIVKCAKVSHEYGACDGQLCRSWEEHMPPAQKDLLAEHAAISPAGEEGKT